VGIHPITIRPTRITRSILSVPDAMMADTNPNTTAEKILIRLRIKDEYQV
jgi:hypothetical protein